MWSSAFTPSELFGTEDRERSTDIGLSLDSILDWSLAEMSSLVVVSLQSRFVGGDPSSQCVDSRGVAI